MIVRNTDFPNLDGLVGLAKNDGVDIRPTLLRVLTDFYVQKPKHSPEETRHYTELALRLIDAVDVQVRATIATRLARHPDAPLPVIHTLARDVIEVARPVLQYAQGLSQRELLTIAQEFGQAYAAVIVTRPDFAPGRTVAESVPETPIEAVEAATPPAHAANPAQELSELFFGADAAERRLILLNLDFTPLPEALPIASSVRTGNPISDSKWRRCNATPRASRTSSNAHWGSRGRMHDVLRTICPARLW